MQAGNLENKYGYESLPGLYILSFTPVFHIRIYSKKIYKPLTLLCLHVIKKFKTGMLKRIFNVKLFLNAMSLLPSSQNDVGGDLVVVSTWFVCIRGNGGWSLHKEGHTP
jgi:hypothetical protein